ncbi:hypothetical protein GGI07_004782 [Coemansia sp. Benny D115]|nr:hypothetical protein GGI07_004782 [Coemansia sp. Benny D115]
MSNVLVIGASGYIGKEAARAFSRAGYNVYALVRSAEKGKDLPFDEITPVVGDVSNPDSYADILDRADIVFDASLPSNGDPVKHTYSIFDAIKHTAAKRADQGGSLNFIYNTGVWLYGNTSVQGVSENTTLSPLSLLSWRPKAEQDALNLAPNVRTIVVRPGVVYGRSGSLSGLFFGGVESGVIRLPRGAQNNLATIHVDDLADFYVKAAAKAQLLKGNRFTVVNPASESVQEIIRAVRQVANREIAVEEYEPESFVDQGISLNQVIDARQTREVVGWQPRKRTLVEGAARYYAAWKAYNA